VSNDTIDDVMKTSSEATVANEGDKSRVGKVVEGSRGSRGEGVGRSSSSERVDEIGVADDSTAEGLKGRSMVETESVGTTESLAGTVDDVMAS
jgi:hypothetical protein